ncbi:MAG: NAD-dependent epimerase/dehydratase family protein, partial [Candidatus Thorarchaeota archaeon]
GTGFVGSHLVRILCKKEHDVTVLVRETSSTSLIEGLSFKRTVGDVRDIDSLLAGVQETEWLFHNAAIMSEWGGKQRFWPVNVEGTRNILETVRRKDIPRLIHTSSTAVYGPDNKTEYMTEDTPKRPFGAYQKSKWAAEEAILEYANDYGIRAAIVRPPTIMGRGDMFTGPQLIRILKAGRMVFFGDGSNLHSIVHGADAARCLVLAGEGFDKAEGNAFNVTSFTTEWKETIDALARELDIPLKARHIPYRLAHGLGAFLGGLYRAFLRYNSPMLSPLRVKLFGTQQAVDDSKARERLGYEPKWDLETTAKDVVEWGGEVKPR